MHQSEIAVIWKQRFGMLVLLGGSIDSFGTADEIELSRLGLLIAYEQPAIFLFRLKVFSPLLKQPRFVPVSF